MQSAEGVLSVTGICLVVWLLNLGVNEEILEDNDILACFTKHSCSKKGQADLIMLQVVLDNIYHIVL